MTTREILAEIDMRGLTVCVIRCMEAGHPQAWSAAISTEAAPHKTAASFDAALLAAWNAYAAQVAA